MKENTVERHSFVIRIWLEDRIASTGETIWRGDIKHVFEEKTRPVQDLDGIGVFIASYLDRMGARLPMCWRIKQWLAQRRFRFENEHQQTEARRISRR